VRQHISTDVKKQASRLAIACGLACGYYKYKKFHVTTGVSDRAMSQSNQESNVSILSQIIDVTGVLYRRGILMTVLITHSFGDRPGWSSNQASNIPIQQ
jgi:uncharacterized membrane protein